MLRRSHKKTKKGSKCDECRRRHIRCDQQHPSCINCQNSDRICVYRSVDQPTAIEPDTAPSTSSTDYAPSSFRADATRGPATLPSPPARTEDVLVDIAHLELFHHFTQGTFLFIDRDTSFTDQLKKTALSSAFSNPFLMHGILAFAGRHISTQVVPQRAQYYLDQSTRLQTWAVANFNPAPRGPDRDTCVAIFLFSSLTCIHGLADIALLDLDPEPFFIRLGQYFGLQRGVRTIIGDHWSQLRESEIGALFQWCELLPLRRGQGSHCDGIRQLVAQSTDLSPSAAEACHFAMEQLQYILDECTPDGLWSTHCIYATLAWPLLVHEKMVDLLVLRRPTAMLILAYYGVTLHFCRDLWMVDQAGKRIVHAINSYLGSSWVSWLQWPCEAVGIAMA